MAEKRKRRKKKESGFGLLKGLISKNWRETLREMEEEDKQAEREHDLQHK